MRHHLRKVTFYRLTSSDTRALRTPHGDHIVTWSSPEPASHTLDSAWLNAEKGAYWGNTEQPKKVKLPEGIQYRRCDCWLDCGWCVCK